MTPAVYLALLKPWLGLLLEVSSPALDLSLVFMGGNEIRLLHFIFCDCFVLQKLIYDYGENMGECLLVMSNAHCKK